MLAHITYSFRPNIFTAQRLKRIASAIRHNFATCWSRLVRAGGRPSTWHNGRKHRLVRSRRTWRGREAWVQSTGEESGRAREESRDWGTVCVPVGGCRGELQPRLRSCTQARGGGTSSLAAKWVLEGQSWVASTTTMGSSDWREVDSGKEVSRGNWLRGLVWEYSCWFEGNSYGLLKLLGKELTQLRVAHSSRFVMSQMKDIFDWVFLNSLPWTSGLCSFMIFLLI